MTRGAGSSSDEPAIVGFHHSLASGCCAFRQVAMASSIFSGSVATAEAGRAQVSVSAGNGELPGRSAELTGREKTPRYTGIAAFLCFHRD